MPSDTKGLRTRIKSVNSTLHLTKAMGLVASSKIRRANEGMFKSRQYAEGFSSIIELLASSSECKESPYLRNGGERTKLIIIAGDRGLAGGYNANVFRLAKEFSNAEFIPIGKRACDKFSRPVISSEDFSVMDAFNLSKELCDSFLNNEYDKLGIICTDYVSIMTQNATVRWVLPFAKSENTKQLGTVFEPDEITILNTAAYEYVAGCIMWAVRESFASEVAARRMAMDSAGKNAQQMIDELQLQYNRARQGAITQEITEIVAGSGN